MAYFGSKYGSPNGVLRGPQDRVPVDPRGRRAQRAVNRPDGAPEGVQKWVHFGVQMGPPWVPTQDTPNTPNPRIRDIHLFRPVSHAWPKQGLAGSGRTLQIGVQKWSKTPRFGVHPEVRPSRSEVRPSRSEVRPSRSEVPTSRSEVPKADIGKYGQCLRGQDPPNGGLFQASRGGPKGPPYEHTTHPVWRAMPV